MKKILISSVGSLIGQNVLDSLEGRREGIMIIGTNSDAEAANNFRCDQVHLVSPVAEYAKFEDDLISIISAEQPDVIVPGRDDDIGILASIKNRHFPSSQDFLCGSSNFAAIMNDKVLSYHFAQTNQLTFVPTLESGLVDTFQCALNMVKAYGFPLIAKPRKGNGSRGIWIITNEDQLEQSCQLEGYAIQPLLGHDSELKLDTTYGLPFVWEVPENSLYAVQVLIDRKGQIISSLSFVSQMVMGKCERITRIEDAALTSSAHQFAKHAIDEGWVGPLNIQFKKDSATGYQAIEMNGRFSGGTSARLHLGFDEVRILLNEWFEQPIIPYSQEQGPCTTITRSLCDFRLPSEHVRTLKKESRWFASN